MKKDWKCWLVAAVVAVPLAGFVAHGLWEQFSLPIRVTDTLGNCRYEEDMGGRRYDCHRFDRVITMVVDARVPRR